MVDTDYSIRAAGGFIIQLLPGLSDEEIDQIEGQLAELPPITTLLDQGATLEQVLTKIVGEVNVMETSGARFRCKCSHERVEQTLISLGKK